MNDILIKKYPFLGYSKNLIEYFGVIGYEEQFVEEFLDKNLKMSYMPTFLSSINSSSDFGIIDNDLIVTQVYPDPPSAVEISAAIPPPQPTSMIYSFCFDTYDGKSKQFYVCYAYKFYENYKDRYYIPKAFCILSQYAYFTTFFNICSTINEIIEKNKIKEKFFFPLELIIYNIVNFTPSPLNFNINLDLFSNEKFRDISNKTLQIKQLSGYPYIDFDLTELFNYLPLMTVIEIFIMTIIEQNMLFFSTNLELLNMVMYIMSMLNYPCNDSTYFWHIVSVSKDTLNLHGSENKFVSKIMTGLLGINCEYDNTVNTFNFSPYHFVVDLDKKMLFLKVSTSEFDDCEEEEKKLTDFLDYIRAIMKEKKVKSYFLKKFITQLMKELDAALKEFNPNYASNASSRAKNGKPINFFNFDENIRQKNRKIQDIFYNFYLNLLMIFYQDNTLSVTFDKIKKEDSVEFEDNKRKFEFFNSEGGKQKVTEDKQKVTEEERTFCEEFRGSMKYKVYFDNFIQEFKCQELYKIPLVFSEEYINIKQKDTDDTVRRSLNYFDVIDKYYFCSPADKNQILNITMNNFYGFIEENKTFTNLTRRTPFFNLNKKVIQKYLNYLLNLTEKELKEIFPGIEIQQQDSINLIEKSRIQELLEEEMLELGNVTTQDLLVFSHIYIFNLTCTNYTFSTTMKYLNSIKVKLEKNNFFTRKYLYTILTTLYKCIHCGKEEILSKMKISHVTMFYFFLVNFLRSSFLLPNEEIMMLLRNFQKELENVDSEKRGGNDDSDSMPEEDEIQIYLTYCFRRDGTVKPADLVETIMKDKDNYIVSLQSGDFELNPKIQIKIKNKTISSYFYSPRRIFEIAKELFNRFISREVPSLTRAEKNKELRDIMINLIFYFKCLDSDENSPCIFLLNGLYTLFYSEGEKEKKVENPSKEGERAGRSSNTNSSEEAKPGSNKKENQSQDNPKSSSKSQVSERDKNEKVLDNKENSNSDNTNKK